MRWQTNFYDFRFKWTTTVGIGIHRTKAWLSQLVNFKNAIWAYGMLQTTFRSSYMNRASVFEWHKRFKEGRESVRDDERCWRSKEVNTSELIGKRVRVRFRCDFWLFPKLRGCRYETTEKMKKTRSLKRSYMEPSRSCWNGTTSALQPEEITSRGTRVSCVYYQ